MARAGAGDGIAEVREVKSIDDAAEARKVLLELKRHCDPLCQARGWRVERLVEMCCCTRDGKNLGVAGYCQSRGDKRTALKIAVRLRAPLPVERVPAGKGGGGGASSSSAAGAGAGAGALR